MLGTPMLMPSEHMKMMFRGLRPGFVPNPPGVLDAGLAQESSPAPAIPKVLTFRKSRRSIVKTPVSPRSRRGTWIG
jgi:hypothetical protein